MKKTNLLLAILFASTLLFSSCGYKILEFSALSVKPTTNLKIDLSKGKFVTAKVVGFVGIDAQIKDCITKALRQAGPEYDLLIDGYVKSIVYPYFSGYKIEATAVSTSQLKAQLGEKGFDEWCKNHNLMNDLN